jgi:dihydroorotase
MNIENLIFTKPDDWHIHLRQDEALQTTVPHIAQYFSRAVIMPNCIPPIIDVTTALEYKKQIIKHIPKNYDFNPLLTIYLTDQTTVDTIKQAALDKSIIGAKLYPKGATTNSSSGVTDIFKIYNTLAAMEKYDLPLLIHGEVTDYDINIFDRETVFISKILVKIRAEFPALKIILEHVTTKDGIDFILANQTNELNINTAATITPHHLLLNTNDLLANGLKPHYYCLPIIKNQFNQEAVIKAALSGKNCFFAGSDSAPHSQHLKESSCCPAGIYHGPNTVLVYAEFFDRYKSLDKLEAFLSFYGADFYNLPRNTEKIKLVKSEFKIPDYYNYINHKIIPFWSGETLSWDYDTKSII